MGLGSIVRDFVRETVRMTEGFDRVFGPQRAPSGVSRQRAREAAARTRPNRRRPDLERKGDGPDLSFGLNDDGEDGGIGRKIFDMDRDRRLV